MEVIVRLLDGKFDSSEVEDWDWGRVLFNINFFEDFFIFFLMYCKKFSFISIFKIEFLKLSAE